MKRQQQYMANFHQGTDLPLPLPPNTVMPSLPLPPMSYINQYTDEAVRRGRVLKPPVPPTAHEAYTMYGTAYHADDPIIKPLEAQGIRRLYPQNLDHRKELKKLNHSILVNYLDLLDIVIVSPDSSKRQDKLDDISLLFIHMHHLINEFRPHQARETLRVMMEVQKRHAYDASDRFQKHLEKVLEIIKQNLSDIPYQDDLDDQVKISDFYRDKKKPRPAVSHDRIMCDIADAI